LTPRAPGSSSGEVVGGESRQTALEPKKAREVIGRGDATVIDINTDDEWGRTGNIAGALRVSEDEVESRLDEIDDDQQVIVVDNEGERSAAVDERLRERGVNAVVLEGGLLASSDETPGPRESA
jgi:rhodanese-related sulfurtransferase